MSVGKLPSAAVEISFCSLRGASFYQMVSGVELQGVHRPKGGLPFQVCRLGTDKKVTAPFRGTSQMLSGPFSVFCTTGDLCLEILES